MNKNTPDKKDNKDKLKALREERKEILSRNREILKKQNTEISSLKKEMKKGAYTIPELAQATGITSDKVLWYVSAMRKYGIAEEQDKINGYIKYLLVKNSDMDKEGDSEGGGND